MLWNPAEREAPPLTHLVRSNMIGLSQRPLDPLLLNPPLGHRLEGMREEYDWSFLPHAAIASGSIPS
jgi:hypothetical protein